MTTQFGPGTDPTGSFAAALAATVATFAAQYRQAMEDTMRRIDRKLLMVVWSLALATTTTVVTIAAPAQATTIAGQPVSERHCISLSWSRTSCCAPSSGTG